MESGSGMMHTWSVLVQFPIHYPHTYPIVAMPYLLVMLIDAKEVVTTTLRVSGTR